MRKLLALTILVVAAGCSGGGSKSLQPGEKMKVMAATPHLASLAMAIAGETATVEMLPPADKPTHDYSPTMEDRRRLEGAHLFLINGMGLEAYEAAKIAEAAKLTLVDCGKDLPEKFLIREEEDEEGHDHDAHDHGHGESNPHVWLSTEGAILQARAITDTFAAFDKPNTEAYRGRLKELESRLTALRDKYKPQIEKLAKRNFVSNHDAFPYFAREFGLKQVGVIQRTPGTNPTVAERRELEDMLKKGGAHAVFLEPGYDETASKEIAKTSGLKLATLDPFDAGKPGARALEEVLEKNLKTVLATLGD